MGSRIASLILRREDAEGSVTCLRGGSFAPLRISAALRTSVTAVAVILTTTNGMACPVCFGGTNSLTAGMNGAIFFLIGIVALVQIGVVALFWSFRRRAKELQRHREQFHVINGGVR